MADPADYYREIYMRGLGGETPAVPVSIAELERAAIAAMEPRAANYVGAGAGSEDTIRANAEAFGRRRIVPRMLRDVAERDLSTTLLGTAMPAPLMLAPIGVQKVVHEDGELATARAAAAVGAPMIASTASHFTLEEIAAAGGADAPRWFQLYWANDRELVESFVGRAERAGYGAIVVTVDTFVPGWKPRDLQQAWLPFLEGMRQRQLLPGPGLPRRAGADAGGGPGRRHRPLPRRPLQPVADLGRPRLAARADLAADPASRGSSTSTTPARRPSAASTASSSPTTAAARSTARSPRSTPCRRSPRRSASELAILFDSGVRGGADVLKALALGADAVCLGRPYIWGLALDGQAGVEAVLKMILGRARPDDGPLRPHPARPARPGLPRRGVAHFDLREQRRDPLDAAGHRGASRARPARGPLRPARRAASRALRGR